MSKVHLFPLITNLYGDTRFPLQWPGNSLPPEPVQVELGVLLAWIENNIALSYGAGVEVSASTYEYTIPSGKWLLAVAVQSASAQAFKCGLSAGTDELVYEGIVGAGAVETFSMPLFGGTSGKTIYFSALTDTVALNFLTL